ncbi:interferon tau-2-like [Mixophyes fleayi]|uniref:interferon tau-2-like n=1 Tax=Mixophyes fleayi TaxID=3061075 RepID=UPI003F4DD430
MASFTNLLLVTLKVTIVSTSLISLGMTNGCKLPQKNVITELYKAFLSMSSGSRPPQTTECDTPEFTSDRSLMRSLFNVSQVDDAVIVIEEVMEQSFRFFYCHHQGLHYKQQEWEKIKGLLHGQTGKLHDCMAKSINIHPLRKNIDDYFIKLWNIVKKENYTTCTCGIIESEMKRILLSTDRLWFSMRKRCNIAG